MPAGLTAYRTVLTDAPARAFSLAGFVARMPISMTTIGIVLLVSLSTGSFGRAGLVAGISTAAGAVSAPLWGRTIDRVGQARVLVTTSLTFTTGLALLAASVLAGWPLALTLLAAAVVGLGFNSSGAAVRARWNHRLQGSPLLETAFAVEAVLDEVIFIVGPVLVTFLATAVHPVAALGTSAALGLVGSFVLASRRSTEPPRHPRRAAAAAPARLSPTALLPMVFASVALGAIFGGMEVVVVAYATESGLLPYAGAFLMAWAVGSLVAGVVVGTITWRRPPAFRFRVGAAALALSLVPLPLVGAPALVAVLLTVSGMAIAPTMIASVGVTRALVPQARLTEALGWNSTGLAAGLALGASVLGQLVDRGGPQLGFTGVVGAGVLLILAALGVRSRG
ncbi:MFS transporter [uncultured Friedmanniella sp.]|uniref:MFS transporter n=1 Tax=uncultured Friedmanniella sp. TaxID=335381 RepID=UPI0035CA5ED6